MTEKLHKRPSATEAYCCLLVIGVLILGSMIAGAPIQGGVVLATAASAVMARRLGFTWHELEISICKRIGKLGGTMLIMWMIGFLLGTMLYSGLLPMLVYYGFQLINPRFLYLSALLVCMLMSTMTGSSWSAAGTAGVACMALAHGHGANMAVMAGAVVAGSVFGDKLSPMSETTNLAPACAGTELYRHIRSQMWTTVPAILIAVVLFAGFGMKSNAGYTELPEAAVIIMTELDSLYTWSIWLMLPVVTLLLMSLLKQPAIPTMFVSSLLNLGLGYFIQHRSLGVGLTAATTGFKAAHIVPEDVILNDKVLYILERGGMTSMVSIILVCFCGFAMTTVLTKAGDMEAAVMPLMNGLNTRWKAMLTAEVATFCIASLAGISYMSSVFVGEAWRQPFLKNKMGLPCLSRTLEDVGTCCTAIIPWCSSAVFFSSTLDVPIWGDGGFAMYAVLPFACPVIAFLLSVFGLGMYEQDIVEAEDELAV